MENIQKQRIRQLIDRQAQQLSIWNDEESLLKLMKENPLKRREILKAILISRSRNDEA